MRRLRLLVYEGEADWIKPSDHQVVRVGSPFVCGRGSIYSMELKPSDTLADNDLFKDGMKWLELMADEVVEAEMRKEEGEF